MNDKIKPSHLARIAYVYIRQSTVRQVQRNKESKRRQYEFQAHAQALGFEKIVVIDDDLGRTGTGSQERVGFARLLAAVCEGKAGAVLAFEASRLARNNRDWHHLIDLCGLTETLIIDHDGIYDPKIVNDRLLLGMKGTMSEFEMNLIMQRGREAYEEMIARGAVLTIVPAGYLRTDDYRVEITPDKQVQETVRGIFANFHKFGSVRQLVIWYNQEGILIPVREEPKVDPKGIKWQIANEHTVCRMIRNPIYAGAFAHGRTRTVTKIVDGRARKVKGVRVPMEEWPVLIKDHHPAYITWEEYLRNWKQLECNVVQFASKGPAKSGAALLSGILRCRRCGQRVEVQYRTRYRTNGQKGKGSVRYTCPTGYANRPVKLRKCIAFGGARVHKAVTASLLEAIEPAGIEAAIGAYEDIKTREDEKQKALALALEKARYEAGRAQRQYDVVDPENRLIAAELETRWNDALFKVNELQTRLDEHTASIKPVTEADREALMALGEDIKATWDNPHAPMSLKKRILRTVIEEIVVDTTEEPREVHLWIHWAGGAHTELRVARTMRGEHGNVTGKGVVELISSLSKVCNDTTIASVLNRRGYRTGVGNTWTKERVRSLRNSRGIARFDGKNRQWLTLQEVMSELGVSNSTVQRLLKQGVLPGQQVVPCAPWVIERKDLELPEVQAAIKAVHEGRRCPRAMPGQTELPFMAEGDPRAEKAEEGGV